MGDNKLKMNDDKTELMDIGTRSFLTLLLCSSLVVIIPFSQFVRNLGFYLDETLSKDANIKY